MSATIDLLDLGGIGVDSTFACRGRAPGTQQQFPCWGYLVRGATNKPILVDTGFRNHEVLTRLGFVVEREERQTLTAQLAAHDLELGDLEMVLMTHLHVDHTGGVEDLPPSVPLVVFRKEMEFAAGGSQTLAYPPEDLHPLVDRVFAPGAMRFLDLDVTGPVTVADGITCEPTGGHTPGSMSIRVTTADGIATICGDVVYDAVAQLDERPSVLAAGEPQISNNFAVSALAEAASIKKAMNGTDVLLPSHDQPSLVRFGAYAGRLDGAQTAIRLPSTDRVTA